VGLVLLFLYGLQGMAILRFLFEKHGIPRILWLLLVAGLAVLAASPRAGRVVILAVPLFGVSENWIRYRVPRSAAPTEES
jgi:asparagine N-glycosylation enzyme membrane subunit Stt3